MDQKALQSPEIALPERAITGAILELHADNQIPTDIVDEASMESFPCSDPPSYTSAHA